MSDSTRTEYNLVGPYGYGMVTYDISCLPDPEEMRARYKDKCVLIVNGKKKTVTEAAELVAENKKKKK